jgi:hypothetical protein
VNSSPKDREWLEQFIEDYEADSMNHKASTKIYEKSIEKLKKT